jgi:post-segregation antitoxin (ccd killing protein)
MVLAGAALSACSSPNASEENLVRQFFRASGLRDSQTLSNFAVVSFDPKTEGTVTDFDVTAVSPERTEPLRVIELNAALTEAEAANKAFNEKKKLYQDENAEAIDRVLKAESAGRKLTGRDAQVQAEWTKWRDESGAEAKKVSSARSALASARPIAELSLMANSGSPTPTVEELNGTLVSKDISVRATVRGADGATSEKNYVLTVQRAVVKSDKGERQGKWIITEIKPA